MLTSRVMRNGAGYATKYLERSDYYAEGEKVVGKWFGKGAEKLGLTGEVQYEQFERVRVGLHPETGEKLRQRKSPAKESAKENHGRNLYDFTISAPKSVSIMAILGEDERLIAAHDRAVEKTLAEMECHAAARVRVNKQDADRITGNMIVACYNHFDSRRLDPQLHTHCAAANMTWDQEETKWKALQAGGIYARSGFLTEVYRNELAHELGPLGYQTVPGKHGPEIAGVPQSLIDKFSQGSREKEAAIVAFIEKHGRAPTNNEISVLVHASRPDKIIDISTAEVRAQQSAQLTPDDARAIAHTREQADRNRSPINTHSVEASLQYALDHVFERVSVAPDYQVLAEALKHGRGQVSLGDLKQALADMQAGDQIIRAGDEIATRASLERERDMIQIIDRGIGKHDRLGKEATGFEISDKLTAEQRNVIEFVLNSRDFAVNIEGAAGTGKTRTLNELRRALQAGGRLMMAVAPTMDAVGELQGKGFQNATTIDSLLLNREAHPLLAGRTIVVDEAGMVGGPAMHDLLTLAKRFDARIVFSGDFKQLQSVPASDALRILLKESQLATTGLREVHRQETKEYREAIQTLRENPARGLAQLEKMGAVKEAALLDRAEAYRNATGKTIVVCPTHEEIGRVTEAIRADLIGREKLGPETTLDRYHALNWTDAQKQDMRNFAIGQVLVFH